MNRDHFETAIDRPIEDRRAYVEDLTDALASGRPWATGKAGVSERAYLHRPLLADAQPDVAMHAFDRLLAFRGQHLCGVFPGNSAFLARWSEHFVDAVRDLDWLGVSGNGLPETARIVTGHRLSARIVDHRDQQPDRSIPADEARCWLPHLRDRRVLLVCPFATVLRERANAATYEAVWAAVGKRWFDPASVEAIEPPYGIEPATWTQFSDCLELEALITRRMDETDYDVALIAAGGLGIPLATHAKRSGRVGISLGGHLQLIFGVYGERWLARERYRDRYFNDAWIGVPSSHVPSDVALAPVRATLENETYW
jgi:hypothetical protein